MAKPAKAKAKTKSPAPSKNSLQEVYDGIAELLNRHVPPFKIGDLAVREKPSLQLVTPKPVTVAGAYGGKPVNWQFAAVIRQKDYVGFYLMGVHSNAELKKKASAALLKTLKGKSCFHLKSLDDQMRKDIAIVLDASAGIYKQRGWV